MGEQFLIVDHTANIMAGVKVSGIWHHGGERRRTDDGSWDRYWRCGQCMKRKLFKISEHAGGATSYAVRHLRNKHNVDVGADEVAIPSARSRALFDIFCYTRFCGATS